MITRPGFWLLFALFAIATGPASAQPRADWPAYGRTHLGDRHSPLTQITPANVGRLEVAWRFNTGETEAGREGRRPARLSATPIVIAGTMYLSTPFGQIVALDAATGARRWRYDANVDRRIPFGDMVSRGVSWWQDPSRNRRGGACARRIFAGIIDGRLIALDAASGQPCLEFGQAGTVDLRAGLRNPPDHASEYEVTSPAAIVGDVVVVGSAVADNNRLDAASGEVRGFDARTGRLLWTFDPVPQDPADPAYATWQGPEAHGVGAANAWSVISADVQRGLVFVPTSSPAIDYWGGTRLGDNAHANSIVALDARTGRRVWSFQTVRHDLWDYDNAAPPALVDLTVRGRRVPAILIATKSGQLFVLDRTNGRPLFPIDNRPVPASDARGETAATHQPFSSLPPLSPLTVTAADIARLPTPPAHRAACTARLASLRNDGPFTPPSEAGSLVMPSNIGGAHWGGVAFDPARRLAIVPVNTIAAVVTLLPRDAPAAQRANREAPGERIGLEYAQMNGSPYVLKREIFSEGGVPCTPGPYGTLHAIDLNTGRTAWNVPLGTNENTPFAAAGPMRGMVNLGGPITTATGLVFIGATPDRYLRAIDAATGAELWRGQLPAGARATPMTYAAGGRQYVAIAAGGDGELWGRSDEVVVFALPVASGQRN